jgi:hypothetical protein
LTDVDRRGVLVVFYAGLLNKGPLRVQIILPEPIHTSMYNNLQSQIKMGASTRAGRRALQSTDSGPCNLASYTLRPKIFAHLDFYVLHLTIRLIQNFCENVKTIMIYLKYISW